MSVYSMHISLGILNVPNRVEYVHTVGRPDTIRNDIGHSLPVSPFLRKRTRMLPDFWYSCTLND